MDLARFDTRTWQGDLKFASGPDGPPIELHSSTPNVVSPDTGARRTPSWACMAMDVVHVLQKGRHDLRALSVDLRGRAAHRDSATLYVHPPAFRHHGRRAGVPPSRVPSSCRERPTARSRIRSGRTSNSRPPSRCTAGKHAGAFRFGGIPTGDRRLLYVDWLRGLAVVIMILWHSMDAWTAPWARSGSVFAVVIVLGGWAAPLFLFLAGCVDSAGRKRPRPA